MRLQHVCCASLCPFHTASEDVRPPWRTERRIVVESVFQWYQLEKGSFKRQNMVIHFNYIHTWNVFKSTFIFNFSFSFFNDVLRNYSIMKKEVVLDMMLMTDFTKSKFHSIWRIKTFVLICKVASGVTSKKGISDRLQRSPCSWGSIFIGKEMWLSTELSGGATQ